MEDKIIEQLYKLALKAYKKNEVPVSAIIIKNNKLIAKAYNKKNLKNNVLYHAEIICLQKAYNKLKRCNLNDCIIYITLEPCNMCKEVIQNSRISEVRYFLKKGELNNEYKKTKYVHMFGNIKIKELMNNFFKKIRK